MSREEMEDDELENVGIMQGFLDQTGEEEEGEEEEYSSDEANAARILNRKPDSPEILMNNLRGDMRSIDARREELADLVGYKAATETPEEVLAMLQPVLAQQAGIGALPQSQAMAQGPQPPMPPPPEGMGAPPMGAPPPPPGGAPSPLGDQAAALMASAGSPSGGGSAAMTGPDGMPIPPEGIPPIAMRNGGFVQRFRDGSDEEGVTPESYMGNPQGLLYSPELIQAAEQRAVNMLQQQPQDVPTLGEAMQSRLPEYEAALAPDKNMVQANMLFSLAGAGLNYAANRGPNGEVLRGSPVSRFAGAFSGLPAAIQAQVGELEKGRQQLKLLALQAGDKDRQSIEEMNRQLATEQRNLISSVVRANASNRNRTSASAVFGKGDWEMNVFNSGVAQKMEDGTATPEERNLFISAVTSYTEPRYEQVVNPDTGLPVPGQFRTLPGKRLPDFVQQMVGQVPPPSAEGRAVRPPPGTEERTPGPLLNEGGNTPTPAGEAVPTDRPVDEPKYLSEAQAFAPNVGVSLWKDSQYIAGPVAGVLAGVTQLPGLGDPYSEITRARSQAFLVSKLVNEAFLKSAQNSVTEQAMVDSALRLKPALIKDPAAYQTQLIGFANVAKEVLAAERAKSSDQPGTLGYTLSPKQRTEARERSELLERVLRWVDLPPAVYTREEVMQLPPGTQFLWQGREKKTRGM